MDVPRFSLQLRLFLRKQQNRVRMVRMLKTKYQVFELSPADLPLL
jgi:hypothetical protein